MQRSVIARCAAEGRRMLAGSLRELSRKDTVPRLVPWWVSGGRELQYESTCTSMTQGLWRFLGKRLIVVGLSFYILGEPALHT